MFDEELDNALKRIIASWQLAEERIKGAEQVRDGEAVGSSIFELRYAGRKIIQVLRLAFDNDGLRPNSEHRAAALQTLVEADECCIKARHDALDAIITFLTLYFHDKKTKLNVKLIRKYFPNFLENLSHIRSVQRKIATSRSDTASSREEIYEEIYHKDYPPLLHLFEQISESADLVEAEIAKENFNTRVLIIFNILMFIFGAAGFLDVAHHYHWF